MSDKKDKIDAYLLGQLSEDEATDFEKMLVSNPDMAEELEFRREVQAGLREVEREEIRDRIKAISARGPRKKPVRYWRIAASVVLLFGLSLGTWWYLQNDKSATGEELFAMYFHPRVELDRPRVPDAYPTYVDTLNERYAAKDFKFVLERLSNLPDSISSLNLQMLEAVTLIELKRDDEANQLLSTLMNAVVPEFADESLWLQSLLHLRHNRFDLAIPMLESIAQDKKKLHQSEAEDILEKI